MLISDWSSDVCSSDLLHLLAQRLEAALGHPVSLDEIREGRYAEAAAAITVATATDGNHGRSEAWGARLAGCRCRIYIHAKVKIGRASCRERVCQYVSIPVVAVSLAKTSENTISHTYSTLETSQQTHRNT